MALINCPECNREVSDAAESCPNCAYPINAKSGSSLKAVRTVEATGKKWKGLQLFSVISVFLGLLIFFNIDPEIDNTAIPAVLMLVGVFGYAFARFGAWWHHQ